MKTYLFLLACCLMGGVSASSQTDWTKYDIQDLEAELKKLNDGHPGRAPICNELGFQYFLSGNLDQSEAYAGEALSLAKKSRNKAQQSDSYVVLGHMARSSGLFPEAESHYLEALALRQGLIDYWGMASCLNSLGVLSLDKNSRYEAGISYLREGLETLELASGSEREQNRLKAKMHNNLADLICRTGDYQTALKEFEASMALRGPEDYGAVFLNQGACLLELGLHVQANSTFHKALSLSVYTRDTVGEAKAFLQLTANALKQNMPDSALYYWGKANAVSGYLDATERAMLLKIRGSIYLQQGGQQEAMEQFQMALDTFAMLENDAEMARLYFDMGLVFQKQKDQMVAIGHYERCRKLFNRGLALPELEVKLYSRLAALYEQEGLLEKAYATNQEYITRADALNENREGALAEANNRVRRLHVQSQILNDAKIATQRRNFAILGILLFLIAASLVFNSYQKSQLARYKRFQVELRLGNALRELEIERNYLQLEDSERLLKWVSKELHDRLGSMLSTIKLYFTDLNKKVAALQKENLGQFEKANTLLDEVSEEVRRISRGALPANLPNRGLVKEIEHLVEHIRSTRQIEVEFTTHGMKERLEMNKERKLYRIIQILVNNILVSSGASWFSLQINRFDDELNIMVEDNGKGFDPEAVKNKGGTGLKNLHALCAELGATVQYDTEMKTGAAVSISMLILQNSNENKN